MSEPNPDISQILCIYLFPLPGEEDPPGQCPYTRSIPQLNTHYLKGTNFAELIFAFFEPFRKITVQVQGCLTSWSVIMSVTHDPQYYRDSHNSTFLQKYIVGSTIYIAYSIIYKCVTRGSSYTVITMIHFVIIKTLL